MTKSLIKFALALTAGALLLAGCGDDAMPGMQHGAPSTSVSATHGGDHNQADITFAQSMIPHHQQALDMAKLATGRSTTPELLDLAGRIERGQDPEIKQMTEWLTRWGATPTSTAMPGMDHGTMPGMMTADEMAQLDQATGTEFDRLWLTMMIRHHQGAIEMATTELQQGTNPDAKTLAQQIIDAQQAEIDEMQTLLPQG
jgi:uncharacterized protein (DUF305 family)